MKNDPAMSPVQQHVKPAPMISTKDLARDRSASSSGSSSPAKSAKSEGLQFCLCQPDPKIPRPRNGELMLSESLLYQHGKSFLFLEGGGFCHS
jgi:HMG box factor